MSDEKFTRGEWKLHGLKVISKRNGNVAKILERWGDKKERQANAHLISAAPDMYRALRAARLALLVAGYTKDHEDVVDIDAALAKADGEV